MSGENVGGGCVGVRKAGVGGEERWEVWGIEAFKTRAWQHNKSTGKNSKRLSRH